MVDYHGSTRRLNIVNEIKKWSRDVLQRPSKFFNGLPPCPYAFDAWVNNRVKIHFGGTKEALEASNILNEDEERVDLVIVVVDSDWDHKEIEPWCSQQNKRLKNEDIVMMPFVPGNGVGTGQPQEEMENWEPLVDEEYAMVFVQRLSDVNAASEALEEAGYYKNCTAEFLKYVKDRRKGSDHARTKQVEGNDEEEEVVWVA